MVAGETTAPAGIVSEAIFAVAVAIALAVAKALRALGEMDLRTENSRSPDRLMETSRLITRLLGEYLST